MKVAGPYSELGAVLNHLCPMHVVLDGSGHVVHAGATARKLLTSDNLIGSRFLEVFELRRPREANSMQDLSDMAGVKLHLRLRNPPMTELKGIFVPLDKGAGFGPPGGAIVNLSFGISVLDAVSDFSLTSADFAPTDLAVEMMFLVEAKSAAIEASRMLNIRLEGAKIAAEEQAFTDTLTGLRNRRGMQHMLQRLLENGQKFALMMLDLDYFKSVNDTLGHAAGDHVLQHVARLMVNETRGDDIIVRTGGDEFVLIFVGLTCRDRVSAIAKRLIDRLEEPVFFNGRECRISASIGSALSSDYPSPTIEAVMADADAALYEAKARGRGVQVSFDVSLRRPETKPEIRRLS